MLLEDGTGSGRTAKINNEYKLTTESICIDAAHHANHDHKQAYELLVFQTPATPNPSIDLENACFCYLKNSSNNDLIIKEIKCYAFANEYIDIYIKQIGTPINGINSTPVNMNLSSSNLAEGTFLIGTSITGMTGGSLVNRLRIPADNNDHKTTWSCDIIIPKNNIITLYAGNGGNPIELSIQFYFHN